MQLVEDLCLYCGMILNFGRISGRRKPECVTLLSCVFFLSISFTLLVGSGSPSRIIKMVATSTGLMNLDWSGITRRNLIFFPSFWSSMAIIINIATAICHLSLILIGKSPDLVFQLISPVESQYLLCSNFTVDHQNVWLFSLSWAEW